MSLIENEFCNVLYRQRLSNSKTYSVQEEMLCAGDLSTGKAICQVSGAVSLLPCPRSSVSPGAVLLLLCLWSPPGLRVVPSAAPS